MIVIATLLSTAAYADGDYPLAIERGTLGHPPTGTPDYPLAIERGTGPRLSADSYFTSGRASGHVPPAPDSTSVTTHSDGSTSTTQTWVKH
jgi:hypothetical protein